MGRVIVIAGMLMLAGMGTVQAGDASNGRKLAGKLCVNCHIVEPGVAKVDATAGVPSFMAIANKPGQSSDKLKGFMLNPHPPMPQVALTTRELDDLAAYITSLKGSAQ